MHNRAYWLGKIDTVKSIIDAYDAAILALIADNGVESYKLDTGQSVQTVTRSSLTSLQRTRTSLLNELATLEARVYGSSGQARPGW
jgi:hypothetical protein